uniref:(northern house mosquito) hypothetical protein n=1 Tax=Culex pipiens TaxID=7175 RepID=A0A8D8NLP3_CULPI
MALERRAHTRPSPAVGAARERDGSGARGRPGTPGSRGVGVWGVRRGGGGGGPLPPVARARARPSLPPPPPRPPVAPPPETPHRGRYAATSRRAAAVSLEA